MKAKITKRSVESIKPAEQDVFLWDTELTGFGCKATPKGSRIYLLQYWRHGRSRRYTIGRHGQGMTTDEARREALRLKAAVTKGEDPAQSRAADRTAPTFADLAARYMAEHAQVKKKPSSAAADARNLRNHILPAFQGMKVAEVSRAEVARLHHAMRATPGAANRCLALLSKMFNLAERWGLRPDGTNPTRHLEKYPERKIERFLSNAELGRLGAALAVAEASGENPRAVEAVRLLVFTGCRRDEILTLCWDHVDFEHACLRLPDSKTGTRTVPLGAPALEVLGRLERAQGNPYVLPGRKREGHLVGLEKAWRRIRARAELEDLRLHDLRHSFASVAAAMGESLLLIGSLLGHADATTTSRYAHLSDDPRRAAAERISKHLASVMADKRPPAEAEVIQLDKPAVRT